MKTSRHVGLWAASVLLLAAIAWWWQGHAESGPAVSNPQGTDLPSAHRAPPRKTDARMSHSPAEIEAAMRRCEADMSVLRYRRWEEIGVKGDAESRLTHALMAGVLGDDAKHPSTASLLDAAAEAAPGDAEIAWYHASHCAKDSGCDREQAIHHLLELEPDNLDAWLMALNESMQRDQDEARLQAMLERAAQAKYYDPRMGETFIRVYQGLLDLPLPKSCGTPEAVQGWRLVAKSENGPTAADMAVMWATSASSAEIKVHSPIMKLCQAHEAPLAPERVAACRPILARIAGGTGMLDQMLGVGMMVRLAADAPDGAQWRERYRNQRWMLANQSFDIRYDRDEVIRRMTEDEVPAREEALRAQGRWPAPEGWLPDDEYARSLIQTGRPPPRSRH